MWHSPSRWEGWWRRSWDITERGGISAARKRDQAAQAAGGGNGGSRASGERVASSAGADPSAPGEDAE